jgi:ribosomal protein S12 methylthiotransferase
MHTRGINNKTIHVVTLGCSKNIVDSERLLKQLASNHLTVRHNDDACDSGIVLINTCGFIQDAKKESVDTILRYIRAKEAGMIERVFVMGCLSERYKKDLEKEIPEVDKYFGVNDLELIISHLGLNFKKELLGERVLTTPGHYAYLKISEGCDRKCSFCAIPLIRGHHLSVPQEDLVREATLLVEKGVQELMLIAQDLTWYGQDRYQRQALPEMVRALSGIRGLSWIRLHYAYPAGFPPGILEVMREKENVCRYLDIPFQHNSDAVLRNMRRGHNREQNYKLIENIRKTVPDITLRTTLITGHPGETEKEFRELCNFVESVKFDRLGVFTYSEEEGTWAARHLKDDIPEKVKRERADYLMDIQQSISIKLNNSKIGNLYKVLLDGREGEYYVGRTEADSPEVDNEVLIPVGLRTLEPGKFYKVRITAAEAFDLYGEVV